MGQDCASLQWGGVSVRMVWTWNLIPGANSSNWIRMTNGTFSKRSPRFYIVNVTAAQPYYYSCEVPVGNVGSQLACVGTGGMRLNFKANLFEVAAGCEVVEAIAQWYDPEATGV